MCLLAQLAGDLGDEPFCSEPQVQCNVGAALIDHTHQVPRAITVLQACDMHGFAKAQPAHLVRRTSCFAFSKKVIESELNV